MLSPSVNVRQDKETERRFQIKDAKETQKPAIPNPELGKIWMSNNKTETEVLSMLPLLINVIAVLWLRESLLLGKRCQRV